MGKFRMEAYRKDKTNISGYEAKKYIAKLKKQEEYKWLSEVNSQSLQEAAIDLEKAYRRFFKKLAVGTGGVELGFTVPLVYTMTIG